MNKARETLESARRIIDNSANWCQGTLEDGELLKIRESNQSKEVSCPISE